MTRFSYKVVVIIIHVYLRSVNTKGSVSSIFQVKKVNPRSRTAPETNGIQLATD